MYFLLLQCNFKAALYLQICYMNEGITVTIIIQFPKFRYIMLPLLTVADTAPLPPLNFLDK